MRPQQQIRCIPFDPLSFESVIAQECGGDSEADQIKYIGSYLRGAGVNARTLVVERPYVDRHYMEEFSRYYASSFRAPPAHAARVHVFASEFTFDDLKEWIAGAAAGVPEREQLERRLQDAYRGFIVIRPLPAAPIGRTLLATYADSPARHFETLQEHRVHLMGIELRVRAVPFQQQEEAVGACATTAAWSALATVSRATGRRGPTPYEITETATRHVLNDRQMPAQSGLDLQQLLAAIRAGGFAPHVIKASENFAAFTHSIKCYLASGIPVVLLVHEPTGYHALTAVGFRSPDDEHHAPPVVYSDELASISTSGLTRLYVHEDRLGPYARMSWKCPSGNEDSPRIQHLRFHDSRYRYNDSLLTVYAAIVPLYPKLRLTPRGLLQVAAETLPRMRAFVGAQRDQLQVELRFKLSGKYVGELLDLGAASPATIAEFAANAALPRYVGIIRFLVGEKAIGDIVCDTTDIYRTHPRFGSILGLVPFVAGYDAPFADFTAKWLTRPERPR